MFIFLIYAYLILTNPLHGCMHIKWIYTRGRKKCNSQFMCIKIYCNKQVITRNTPILTPAETAAAAGGQAGPAYSKGKFNTSPTAAAPVLPHIDTGTHFMNKS